MAPTNTYSPLEGKIRLNWNKIAIYTELTALFIGQGPEHVVIT